MLYEVITAQCQSGGAVVEPAQPDHVLPYLPQRHDRRAHRNGMRDESDHDEEACRDQSCAQIDKPAFPAPDEIDDMPHRHLERPRDSNPEAERGEEVRREAEVLLDKERADDSGETRITSYNVCYTKLLRFHNPMGCQFYEF